jgi:uncharacterized protein (TIGR02271 family)
MVPVTGDGGWRGEMLPAPDDPLGDGAARYLVRPEDGGVPLLVPAALFQRLPDGGYHLPLRREDAERFANARAGELAASARAVSPAEETIAGVVAAAAGTDEKIVVPVVEERLRVGKQLVETGRIRIIKTVSEREEVVEQDLVRDEVHVERLPVNRVLAGPDDVPQVRQEGDTMVIPVVEEVIVVEKRLVLKEELHVTRRTITAREPIAVTVRREEARVERVPAAAPEGGVGAASTTAASRAETLSE